MAPLSTYRIQLTPAHGFGSLEQRADYLRDLGVGHAYLSPVLQATPGSTHGYDVVDHGHVSYELGGEPELLRAAAALADRGIGVVVDVVPNHMALPVPEHLNAAFWSVLRDGGESPSAEWFDIDWTLDQPVLIPVLGRRIGECLDAGEITLERQGGPDGLPVVRYYEHVLPVRPGTEDLPLEDLLAAQHYRLAYWRAAGEELNYRRFFDVDTLLGFRVEQEEVFDASHGVLLRLVRDGVVSGLRIDHPDGLADPRGYLRRLSAATGGAWVVVEKILEGDEELPPDWECAGTTGYEALQRVCGLFVDPDGGPVLTGALAALAPAGDPATLPWEAAQEQARRDVLGGILAAEVDRLAAVAYDVCQSSVRLRDFSRRGLTEALVELLAAVPVYRAYVVPGEEPPEESVRVVDGTAEVATSRLPARAAEIALLRDLALGRLGRGERRDEFCLRFQQTTGPAVAKGVEDTAFYRWFPLSALDEVGGEPARFGFSAEEVHTWAARRQQRWPDAMTALSTHDTKRSEDVRARLAALSERPDLWVEAIRHWRDISGGLTAPDGTVDGATGWLLWQTLVGAWPIDAERLSAYLVKATREAKLRTSWTAPDEEYERHLVESVHRLVSDEQVAARARDVVAALHPGFVGNVLGQRAVQLLLPGVPDVYQGCETVSLRLVDPDNRVQPDQDHLDALLRRSLAESPDPYRDLDAAKMRLTALGLRLRRDRPGQVGARGSYQPLAFTGPAATHGFGFARGDDLAVTVTRFSLRLNDSGGWQDTVCLLPDGTWRDLLTGATHHAAGPGGLRVSALHARWPVTLLVRQP
ncbi:MAG: malto-oligosyltrehalose synthase [Candidatus Nanopelagicales bacterium]